MSVKDAVVNRILQLCDARKIRPNELANLAGVTPSTVYSLLDSRRRDVSVITVKKLCDGLDITLEEFFSGKEFFDLEQDVTIYKVNIEAFNDLELTTGQMEALLFMIEE